MHAQVRAEVLAALASTYDEGSFVLGDRLAQFEAAFAHYCGIAHCRGVASGLDALTLALRALDIGPGDEVIVPAHTFVATPLAVLAVGARPVLAEPLLDTANLDPAAVRAAITPRTRAVVPVHLYGQPCQMDALLALASQYGLAVVEDNAQAQGARWDGKPTGGLGHLGATSFYPTKNLGALGDGGAITTHDAALAERVGRLRNYGSAEKYRYAEVGTNARLDDLQAAVLAIKLRHLDDWNAQRRQIAAWYNAHLAGLPDLCLPLVEDRATPVYHLYVVRTPRRAALQAHLAAAGIGTGLHYPQPFYRQPAFRAQQYHPADYSRAEALAATVLSLPMYPGLAAADVAHIAGVIAAFLTK